MAIDNLEWTWGSEYKRARMLRDALDDAQAERAATSRRLTSRISELQGTLQGKLDALSTSFDAFVELGDIREQLQELPDWSHTRRAVQTTLSTLTDGERPLPLDPAVHDHWLADAMNAVVALVAGEDAGEFERRALGKSEQAPVFIVTTLLALGAGERTQGRVAAVFEGVSTLDEDQTVLLKAAAAGFAPPEELPGVGRHLAAALDESEAWRSWLGLRGGSTVEPDVIADFLETGQPRHRTRFRAAQAEPDWDYEQVGEQLVQRAGVLARSGSKDEARLRTRAAQLRQKIEDPTGEHPTGPRQVSVTTAVQDILTHPDTPEESRHAILEWLHRPIGEIVSGWRELDPGEAATQKYTMAWGPQEQRVRLEVSKDGPSQSDLRNAERQIQSAEAEKGHVNAFFGGAAVAAAAGVLTLFAGSSWLASAIILLAIALVLVLEGSKRMRNAKALDAAKSDAISRLRDGVKQVTEQVQEKEAERLEKARETDETLAALLARLRPGGAPGPQSGEDQVPAVAPQAPTGAPEFQEG